MKNLFKALLIITGLTLFSCSTESTESEIKPESKVAVDFNTVQSPFTTQASIFKTQAKESSTSGTLSFTEGYIAISKLEFEAESENNSVEIEFELEQNTLIDFATGTTTPDINFITIPAGSYEEVEIGIELREDSEEPAILLFGTYIAPDGVEHSVRFEFSSEESFEVEREGEIILAENEVAIAQITFDPSLWFAEVTDEDFANATKDAEEIIVINSMQNTEIYDKVAEGLDLASDVEMEDEDDVDDDHEDDEDED